MVGEEEWGVKHDPHSRWMVVTFIEIGSIESRSVLEEFVGLALLMLSIVPAPSAFFLSELVPL